MTTLRAQAAKRMPLGDICPYHILKDINCNGSMGTPSAKRCVQALHFGCEHNEAAILLAPNSAEVQLGTESKELRKKPSTFLVLPRVMWNAEF